MKSDKEFQQTLTKEFDEARAQLERSKQTRASLHAAIRHADEVSKRTHALLNKDK
ncbi:hypothetical protein [Arvimicrobium flavum]|uniref:hypothetical protein n=1 Tax=Arvimicrobium flavum TaxID=3393320 RepID=UPI00237BA4C4|nr:hypothetical protein [Mesorhizobium shangrilense]